MTDRRDEPTLVTHTPTSKGAGGMRLLAEGERVGRYTIVGLLGRGGMGAVYEAEDPELARRVAIKILHEDRNADERDALRREAQALATLVHQNVVMVYDVGVDADGDVFLVMQLVEGETIDAWIARTKPSADSVIAKFKQAGAGLAAAHGAGLVHCDFKPANILIDDQGAVRVGDFGLARRSQRITARGGNHEPTKMTTLAGTPAYMAPEQFDGLVTPASDQFAFCVALWECLAGQRPFEDSSVATLDPASRGARRELPPNKKIPRYARRVLERGMSEHAGARFGSMTALLEALQPRRGIAVLIAASAGAALVGGAIVYFATRSTPEPARWDGADLGKRQLLTTMGTEGCAYAPVVDGDTVVFDRTRGEVVDLYTVPLSGGPLRQLTSGPNWEWRAQRGRRPGEVSYLLTDRTDEKESQVRYRDLATGEDTVALRSMIWDAVTVGDKLIYSPHNNKGLWMLRGNQELPFAIPPSGFTYFAVGASTAGDQLGVTRIEANSGAVGIACTIATTPPYATRCYEDLITPSRPAFGRDSTVLYIAGLDGIVRRDLVTGETTKISDDYAEGGLTVAPDGSALLFSLCRTHSNIIDPLTNKIVVDDPDGNQPAPSSHGAVAWVRAMGSTQVLMLRAPDGRITQLTTIEQGSAANPRFSPDNKFLAFAMAGPKPGIHVIELDRPGSLRQVTTDKRDIIPHWAGNNMLAFSQIDEAGAETVFTIQLDGTKRRALTGGTRNLLGARGTQLLVAGVKGSFWHDPTTGNESPGPPRPESEADTGSTSPSGNWVVYQVGADGHTLYRTKSDGSAPLELVHRFESNYYVTKPAITDDGQIIINAGPMYGDLVKIPAKPGSYF